jgi:light-regulated signal transduction histidine kinase (bacteriophytochrome)
MGTLIEDILAFSRLGRQRLRKDKLNTEELVREVLEDYADEISRRGIVVEIDPLNSVHADRSLLRQVFANLISNAVKFTRENPEARICIAERPTDRGPAIVIEDNGVGFDGSAGKRLFGVFQRLHNEDRFDGTGVGLAIVERIVDRHGGEVWFEAEVGSGAAFFFTLPEAD